MKNENKTMSREYVNFSSSLMMILQKLLYVFSHSSGLVIEKKIYINRYTDISYTQKQTKYNAAILFIV